MSRLPMVTADHVRRAGRHLIGPLLFAIAVWCAAGVIASVDPLGSDSRAAVPASLWWFAAGLAVGVATPGFRRQPALTTPAVLAVLPWLPLPLPPVALIWSGALAWLPVGLSLYAGLFGRFAGVQRAATPHGGEADTREDRRLPHAAPFVAGALTLIVALVAGFVLAPRLPGGDEPHYLVITQSLLLDGDLRIENNHARRDYAAYVDGTMAPDFLRRGTDGQIYSIHAPGVSVLVLPLFALVGYPGAQFTVMLTAALAGGLIWLAGWLATGSRAAAWFGWAAVTGSATFVLQSVMIFPDGPAVLSSAAAVVVALLLRRASVPVSHRTLIAVSALLTALPWLHTRFAVLAAGLAALIAVNLVRGRRFTEFRRIGVFLLVPSVGAVLWFAFFVAIYGTPDPRAPYGDAGTRLAYIPGGLGGLLFDAEFGLLTYAPVLALAVIGWTARRRVASHDALPGAALAVALYLAAVGTFWMWWAGVPATPARFATAALPLLVPAIAVGWAEARPVARAIWTLLLIVSLSLGALLVGAERGVLAWNARDASAEWLLWLGSIANLRRGWPSFFWQLTPGDVTSEAQFALHVMAWMAVLAGTGLAATAIARRYPAWPPVLVAAWWLPIAGMAAFQTGWFVTGAAPLEPATAQLRLWRAAGAAGVWRIEPLGVPSLARASSIQVRVPRAELAGPDSARWTPLMDVPAGRYRVTVRSRRTGNGEVFVRLAEGGLLHRSPVRGQHSSFMLDLPAGAHQLLVEADGGLGRGEPEVDVSLQAPGPRTLDLARSAVAFPRATIFFLDQTIFPEPDGFWVHGSAAVRAVIQGRPGAAVTLTLTNGPHPNDVTVEVNRVQRELPLAGSAGGRTDIVLDDEGRAWVSIASPAGFSPSDTGASEDYRNLGVRVSLE